MSERDTAFLIEQWGIWLRQGDRVDLSARSALANLIPEKRGNLLPADITDDDALKVDRAIAQLRKTRPLMARVLWLQFACGYSNRKVAAFMGCGREEASNMSGRAVGLVDSMLNPSDVFTLEDLEQMVALLKAA